MQGYGGRSFGSGTGGDSEAEKLEHRSFQQLGAPVVLFRNDGAHREESRRKMARSWRVPRENFTAGMPIHHMHSEITRLKAQWNYTLDEGLVKDRLVLREGDWSHWQKGRLRDGPADATADGNTGSPIDAGEDAESRNRKRAPETICVPAGQTVKDGSPVDEGSTSRRSDNGDATPEEIQPERKARAQSSLARSSSESSSLVSGSTPPARPSSSTSAHTIASGSSSSSSSSPEVPTRTLYEHSNADHFTQAGRLAILTRTDWGAADVERMIKNMDSYDAPYAKSNELKASHGTGLASNATPICHQRQMTSDPAYLAPFGLDNINTCMDGERDEIEWTEGIKGWKRSQPDTDVDPLQYGNCVLCISCQCHTRTSDGSRIQHKDKCRYILHACGHFQERLRLSAFTFRHQPFARPEYRNCNQETANSNERRHEASTSITSVDVGDTILEVKQCGTWDVENRSLTVAVRTSTHVSLLKIQCVDDESMDDDGNVTQGANDEMGINVGVCSCRNCGSHISMKETQRIDLRSMTSLFGSYHPVCVAAHPKYGNSFTDPKLVIVSHTQKTVRNVIHEVDAACPMHNKKHTMQHLKEITLVDFTQAHPMCLWAAGRSFVAPTLSADPVHRRSASSNGTGLYHIDLRSNKATFQWSPSANEMMTEGMLSISGIHTDWRTDSRFWISSIDGGKVWEFDGRMPFKPVTAWLLGHSTDDHFTSFQTNGLRGGGTIFSPIHPNSPTRSSSYLSSAIFAVNKSRSTFGLHLYQSPRSRPLLQTEPVEVISTPNLRHLEQSSSVATTAVYPIPKLFDSTSFISGLSAIEVPIEEILSPQQSRAMGVSSPINSALCVLTSTNQGDLMAHALVDAPQLWPKRADFEGLAVGIRALAVPIDGDRGDVEHAEDAVHDDSAPVNTIAQSYSLSSRLIFDANNKFPTESAQTVLNAAAVTAAKGSSTHDDISRNARPMGAAGHTACDGHLEVEISEMFEPREGKQIEASQTSSRSSSQLQSQIGEGGIDASNTNLATREDEESSIDFIMNALTQTTSRSPQRTVGEQEGQHCATNNERLAKNRSRMDPTILSQAEQGNADELHRSDVTQDVIRSSIAAWATLK